MARNGRATTPAAVPRARRGYHHGDLRRALVDAALRLIERDGPDALKLREAARRAGVSQAAPYRHFPNRRALLAAVAEEGFRLLAADMRVAADRCAPGDVIGRFRAVGLAYIAFARRHTAHFRVMFGRQLADRHAFPSVRDAASDSFRLLESAIADCQRAGFVAATDPQRLAVAAWSMTHGLASLLVDDQLRGRGDDEPDALAEAVTAVLFFGLAAEPARQPASAGTASGAR